jgi:hypothetical protein
MIESSYMRSSMYKSQTFAILLTLCGLSTLPAFGQTTDTKPAPTNTPAADAQEAARRKVLDSDRWRRTQREFDEWLSVQTIYSPDEVAAIKANFSQQIARMSPRELEDFLKNMESRLKVLMSPEAEDARQWLAQFMAVAVDPERQLGRSRPDVLNMTAAQIRQELAWLQQTRDARQQSQAVFDRRRAAQSQVARDARARRQQAQQPVRDRSSWPANNPRRPSQYAPQPELLPQPLPTYMVSPWGHPINWARW